MASPPSGDIWGFLRSLKYLNAEKNDEKFRQTFGGMENLHYLLIR